MSSQNQPNMTDELIAHLARLSRIRLSEEEREMIPLRLLSTVSLIGDLSNIDCSNVMPLLHPLDLFLMPRQDEPLWENNRVFLERVAPLFEEGLYLVPPVIATKKDKR